jgi:hypothetical protein
LVVQRRGGRAHQLDRHEVEALVTALYDTRFQAHISAILRAGLIERGHGPIVTLLDQLAG